MAGLFCPKQKREDSRRLGPPRRAVLAMVALDVAIVAREPPGMDSQTMTDESTEETAQPPKHLEPPILCPFRTLQKLYVLSRPKINPFHSTETLAYSILWEL